MAEGKGAVSIRYLDATQLAPYGFYDNVAGVLAGRGNLVATPESALEIARILEWGWTGNDPACTVAPQR